MPRAKKSPKRGRNPRFIAIHPGEILRTEFMEPVGLTAERLAVGIHSSAIHDVLREKRPITADLALRLGKFFGVSAEMILGLQNEYDLRIAASSAPLGRIRRLKTA